MTTPGDPITPLVALAAQLHELYEAYVHAGFTEEQAFELVRDIIRRST